MSTSYIHALEVLLNYLSTSKKNLWKLHLRVLEPLQVGIVRPQKVYEYESLSLCVAQRGKHLLHQVNCGFGFCSLRFMFAFTGVLSARSLIPQPSGTLEWTEITDEDRSAAMTLPSLILTLHLIAIHTHFIFIGSGSSSRLSDAVSLLQFEVLCSA